jgi:TPR repeat protein
MWKLALRHIAGFGVLRNEEKAYQLFAESARGGCIPAQSRVLLHGIRCAPDPAAALNTLLAEAERAADGDVDNSVALMFERGEGTPEDMEMAVRYYTRAARRGHPSAVLQLVTPYRAIFSLPSAHLALLCSALSAVAALCRTVALRSCAIWPGAFCMVQAQENRAIHALR